MHLQGCSRYCSVTGDLIGYTLQASITISPPSSSSSSPVLEAEFSLVLHADLTVRPPPRRDLRPSLPCQGINLLVESSGTQRGPRAALDFIVVPVEALFTTGKYEYTRRV